ncbi:MAG: CBS domain-containing protein [Candidatus Methylomirabilota bacterium]|jgi:predicted transcriptional regulator
MKIADIMNRETVSFRATDPIQGPAVNTMAGIGGEHMMKVTEFMNREVVALRPEDPIQEGARLLVKNSAAALPVVNR